MNNNNKLETDEKIDTFGANQEIVDDVGENLNHHLFQT